MPPPTAAVIMGKVGVQGGCVQLDVSMWMYLCVCVCVCVCVKYRLCRAMSLWLSVISCFKVLCLQNTSKSRLDPSPYLRILQRIDHKVRACVRACIQYIHNICSVCLHVCVAVYACIHMQTYPSALLFHHSPSQCSTQLLREETYSSF